jgi:hypothetical protein
MKSIVPTESKMETFRNQTFQGKSFVIEDVAFVNCRLTDCDLYYSGGDFDWMNSHFENCRFHWRGPAKNSLALFQSIGMISGQIPSAPLSVDSTGQKVN